jgi:hypothetical protein
MGQIRDQATTTSPASKTLVITAQNPDSPYGNVQLPLIDIPVEKSQITQVALARYQQRLQSDIRNADGTVLDATGASTKFKIVVGGYGSGTLKLQGRNANGGTVTDTLAFEFAFPPQYDDDDDVRVVCHMKVDDSAGTVGTKTLDCQVYELGDAGTVGSDLCSTTILTTTNSFADYTFIVTDSGLVFGDRIIVFLRTVVQETASGGNIFAQIGNIEMHIDIKG